MSLPIRRSGSKKEAAKEQKSEHEYHGVNKDFDKTHKITYSKTVSQLSACEKPHFNSVARRMSKTSRLFLILLVAAVLITWLSLISPAQALEARIMVIPGTQPLVRVEGRFLNETRANRRNLVFLKEYAGVSGLANRMNDVAVKGADSEEVASRMLAPGEYLAAKDIVGWKYAIQLFPQNALSRAHISWIDGERGILMLNDMLPQVAGSDRSAKITIGLPDGWQAVSAEATSAGGNFNVKDIDKAVFLIARKDLLRSSRLQNADIGIAVADSWQFTDSDAARAADEIFREYSSAFGPPAAVNFQAFVMKLPAGTPFGQWEGDTRGNTVTIVSSDMPFATQSSQRIREQLRHEVFHFWFPNGLKLSGNYDWFFEGFALYESLKTGVTMNQLSFDNFLDTLSRAYNIEIRGPGRSLIDSSKQRWSGQNTELYARGMLTAFVVDVSLLSHSGGRRSSETLLREIFREYSNAQEAMDGNEAVLGIMGRYRELKPIIDRFIIGNDRFDWSEEILAAGIESSGAGTGISLRVRQNPNRKQKDILNRLGYNSWRKLLEK